MSEGEGQPRRRATGTGTGREKLGHEIGFCTKLIKTGTGCRYVHTASPDEQKAGKVVSQGHCPSKVIVLPEPKMSVSYYSSAVSKRLKHSCFFLHWPTLMQITYYCH